MPESVYIHIPFCKSKCKYCSFVSYNKPELMGLYAEALIEEIKHKYRGERIRTLYFGGGTPSLMSQKLLEKIISLFSLSNEAEVTLELNPDDADNIRGIKETGVNRLSIGSQTFDDKILKFIGRRHCADDIIKAVKSAKRAGFENISVDLIYGLPMQTLEGVRKDLEKFLSLDIQHISTYGLKIEEESYWGRFYDGKTNKLSDSEGGGNASLSLPDEDMQADMYEEINAFLNNNGFCRYEISNFAKSGFESRHNLNYWNNEEYYGFGAAAHGYVGGIRYSNYNGLETYIHNPCESEKSHQLTKKEQLEEEIFLGLRKTEGVNVKKIKDKFGIDFGCEYKNILDKYSEYFEKDRYALNLKGILVSNIILSEFL